MFVRALVVLLLILNLGVATWWATRGAPDGRPPVVLPDDVARLQLADEAAPMISAVTAAPALPTSDNDIETETAAAASAPADAAATSTADAAATPATAGPPQCHALGPFADVASRDAARDLLAPLVVRIVARDVTETPRGWRVWMAPLEDRSAADAAVARLVAAGFTDYYVIASGDEADGIALGRFGSVAGAESRAGALRAAGFEVETAPLGSVLVRHWLDVMAAEGATGASLRARVAAARAEPRDCNAVGEAG